MIELDYDRVATEYARHRQVHPGVLQGLCSAIVSDAKVLEVGCGTGNYISAIESYSKSAPIMGWGVDPSKEMLSRARERSETVRFQIGRAERLEFDSNLFDLVFSVDVIHHVSRHLDYFQEAYRVLEPNGRVCTVTDSEWIIRHRQPLATYFPETVEVELARYPRVARLCALMKQAGFHPTGAVEDARQSVDVPPAGHLRDEITERTVRPLACPYQLTDIQAYRDKAFSALHIIPEEAFQRGIARMESDLRTGPIPCVARYVLLWGKK